MKDACSGYHKTQITFMPAERRREGGRGYRDREDKMRLKIRSRLDTGTVHSLLEKNVSIII